MSDFKFQKIFEQEDVKCDYRLLTEEHVSELQAGDLKLLKVEPEALSLLAEEAVKDLSHLYRSSHLQQLKDITQDSEASENDVYVARTLLENAVISARMEYPGCQDTGTAIIHAKKGEAVITGAR